MPSANWGKAKPYKNLFLAYKWMFPEKFWLKCLLRISFSPPGGRLGGKNSYPIILTNELLLISYHEVLDNFVNLKTQKLFFFSVFSFFIPPDTDRGVGQKYHLFCLTWIFLNYSEYICIYSPISFMSLMRGGEVVPIFKKHSDQIYKNSSHIYILKHHILKFHQWIYTVFWHFLDHTVDGV